MLTKSHFCWMANRLDDIGLPIYTWHFLILLYRTKGQWALWTLDPTSATRIYIWGREQRFPAGACTPLTLLQYCQKEFRRHGGHPGKGGLSSFGTCCSWTWPSTEWAYCNYVKQLFWRKSPPHFYYTYCVYHLIIYHRHYFFQVNKSLRYSNVCIDPLSMRSEIHSMCQTCTCHSLTHQNLFFTISYVDTLLHNDLM